MLKSIRCGHCKKLLFSTRWKGRRPYDQKHMCPGMAEYLRKIELRRLLDQLYAAQRLLSRTCATATALAEEAEIKPLRRKTK